LSSAVQLHPSFLDFWLVGVYTELDIKGNLFSSRKLMLQALRNNEKHYKFHIEYLRFEVNFHNKIMQRREILHKGMQEDDKKDKL
jgi:hypothetical protein